MELLQARHPDRLDAERSLIIEDLLELVERGKHEGVSAIVEMLADLHDHGRNSRFLRTMKGMPIMELRTQSRGGEKGGARVYLFITEHDQAGIVNCEVKQGATPDLNKFRVVLEVLAAYKKDIPVFRVKEGG